MDETTKLLAFVALAAFATERILAAANYLLDADRLYRQKSSMARRLKLRERRKIFLFALAAAVTLAVVDRADLRIIERLSPGSSRPILDYWLTWLVLFAGADRVRDLLSGKTASRPAEKKEPALVIDVVDKEGKIHALPRAS